MAYILNKKQLFNNTISKNSTIGKIYFDNYDNSISLNIQYNFYENGKAIFTENEIRNGLRGKIHWDSPYKKNHLPKTNTASNFSDEDISSDEGISNTDSVYGFKFQFNFGDIVRRLSQRNIERFRETLRGNCRTCSVISIFYESKLIIGLRSNHKASFFVG
mgnify:CR=1 FL=1